jgi:hypothetical protein
MSFSRLCRGFKCKCLTVSDCRRLSIYKHGYIDLVTIGIYKSTLLRSSFKHDRGRQYSIEVGSTLSRQAVLY